MRILEAILASAVLGLAATTAPAEAPAGELYRLGKESTYQKGCFEGCACPVTPELPITGTFRLTSTGFDGLFEHYDVTEVNWVVSLGGEGFHLTGSGTYRIGGEFAVMQQLVLDLSTNGQEPEHFDSGLVAGGAGFPLIDIVITINQMYCYDTVIHVVARPWPAVAYRLGRDSTYQEGCFDPCDCPILEPLPMTGTFALTLAESNSLGQTYAVTDVAWDVAFGDQVLHITGAGTYQIGGEFALVHRLQLDLSTNGEPPRHFDSGQVPGGYEFPAIDIEISMNNLVCYDVLMHVRAKPGTGDSDLDGDVDQDDCDRFESCATGSNAGPAGLECVPFDLDDDDDIDQTDFGFLQRCLSGADSPADPACAG